MKKCLLLTRVSTKYQDFTPQEEDLKKYANDLGYEVAGVISTKESGFRTIERKDGFKQVKEFFSTNPDCRTLIITELSRLSRYDDVLIHCKTYFKENKIQLIVKDISFRLFDENGNYNYSSDITFNLFATIASSEMQQKKDRFQRAKTALREDGYIVGGRPRYGYKIVEVAGKRKTLEIIEEQAEQIRQVFDMYLKGKSIRKVKVECIAKGFDTYFHSSTNIQKCLRESAYIGTKTTNNKRKNYQYYELGKTNVDEYVTSSYTYSHYPEIVDKDIFDQVQTLLTHNCPEKSSRHISILAKLLYVAECDCSLIAEVKKYPAYACKRECKYQNACNKKRYSVSMKLVDSIVWQYLKENVELIEQEQLRTLNAESIANLQQEIANIELKIAEKEKEQAKEVNLYRIEAITLSELESRVSVIKKDIGSFRSAIKNKQAEIDNINDFLTNRLNESVTDMVLAAEGNPAEMKKYVNRFIKKIVVHLSDRYHSILEVIPKKYMGAIKAQSFVVPVIDEDEDGNIIESGYEVLQTEDMKFEINDSDYIVIDKKRMLAFAIDNTILAHSVTYDREQRGFVYTNDYNGGVPLSTETLVGLYLISQSSNKEAVKALRESFGITFKSLTY
ncbi:MAG: recombinase family protein [Alistipes sp.]|nr:recombinase family protein [Alistipes sp.]